MDWQTRMNMALDYLESHLEDEIVWERAAAEACCSTFHFLRMFEVISGISASEYVRRRRLSLAALQLAANDVKVIDLAVRLGYDSPDSFARAFKREFDMTPTEARERGARLKTWPRFRFSLTLTGDTSMNFRIESYQAMRLTGLPLRTSTEGGRAFAEIPDFWKRVGATEAMSRLVQLIPAGSEIGLAGVSAGMEPASQSFTYLIAIESPADRSGLPEGCVDVTTKAGTWAIFDAVGAMPAGIQKTISRIYGEWFPTSGYEHAGGPELEVYPQGDVTSDDYRSEVWIPVVKAS